MCWCCVCAFTNNSLTLHQSFTDHSLTLFRLFTHPSPTKTSWFWIWICFCHTTDNQYQPIGQRQNQRPHMVYIQKLLSHILFNALLTLNQISTRIIMYDPKTTQSMSTIRCSWILPCHQVHFPINLEDLIFLTIPLINQGGCMVLSEYEV